MTPRRAGAGEDWGAVLALIRESFAYMDGRVDPPSSVHLLSEAELARQAEAGEVWLIGAPVLGCLVLTVRPGALYIGKLVVSAAARRIGLARRLIDLAEERARALGLPKLELQTRVELTENHAAFAALGFRQTAATAHAGYDRPTSLTFCRQVFG